MCEKYDAMPKGMCGALVWCVTDAATSIFVAFKNRLTCHSVFMNLCMWGCLLGSECVHSSFGGITNIALKIYIQRLLFYASQV